jgi:hypothetical protein
MLGGFAMVSVRGDKLLNWIDGVAIMQKKGEWVTQLQSLRCKLNREGFGVNVFDEGRELRLVKVPKGKQGRPRKDVV